MPVVGIKIREKLTEIPFKKERRDLGIDIAIIKGLACRSWLKGIACKSAVAIKRTDSGNNSLCKRKIQICKQVEPVGPLREPQILHRFERLHTGSQSAEEEEIWLPDSAARNCEASINRAGA